MGKTTKMYSEEFKRQVVALKQGGRKTGDIVREYGVTKTSIYEWEKQFSNSGKFGALNNLSETEKELRAAQKELKQLRMENDILKQAALILARKDV